jgi:hypothetical protein
MVFEDGLLVPREPAITVGPAPEVSGPGSEMPSIREIRRKYRCGQAKAIEIQRQMSGTGTTHPMILLAETVVWY